MKNGKKAFAWKNDGKKKNEEDGGRLRTGVFDSRFFVRPTAIAIKNF